VPISYVTLGRLTDCSEGRIGFVTRSSVAWWCCRIGSNFAITNFAITLGFSPNGLLQHKLPSAILCAAVQVLGFGLAVSP
jgi:hypothetical protein